MQSLYSVDIMLDIPCFISMITKAGQATAQQASALTSPQSNSEKGEESHALLKGHATSPTFLQEGTVPHLSPLPNTRTNRKHTSCARPLCTDSTDQSSYTSCLSLWEGSIAATCCVTELKLKVSHLSSDKSKVVSSVQWAFLSRQQHHNHSTIGL